MIAVDASALIAMLLNEPERSVFSGAIKRAGSAVVSSATLLEARMVAYGRGGQALVDVLDKIVPTLGLQIVPVGVEHIDIAYAAFVTYGNGNGHPANLNYGDFFSYALAKPVGAPLLFKGEAFSRTDIERAA